MRQADAYLILTMLTHVPAQLIKLETGIQIRQKRNANFILLLRLGDKIDFQCDKW